MNRILPALLCAMTLAAPAMAQTAAGLAPATERWPAVVIAWVLFACVFAVSIMGARRTHLD